MNYSLGKYGTLNNAVITERYSNGEVESFKVEEENTIHINGHTLIPRYTIEETRTRESPAIRLYKTGEIKSIDLEKSTTISIKDYTFNVEKIVFYKSGAVKKIFPLNGKVSGYWTQDDEYNLAESYKFKFDFTEFSAKLISIKFYDDEKIKSITLWPREKIIIHHNNLIIENRIGFSLYKSGKIMTCEPSKPVYINTPIGKIKAYDINSIGIHGEDNSLKFNEDGTIRALKTSTNTIVVINNNDGRLKVHQPRSVSLYANSDLKELTTVDVEFDNDNVIINKDYIYNRKEYYFVIKEKSYG
ncbi:hypothetical protein CM240_3127 [Clostridium bornimense]|uniref:Uncharacterized protein n=1 Tax=Clostridium bornimense TaxID=1216932 RepID=W6S2V4_9CLOT|nr:hypothetical protein [Clostridium bornimense]CDM70244.1 hypothetical protein CM240_3127 [Clostridium bornimense]